MYGIDERFCWGFDTLVRSMNICFVTVQGVFIDTNVKRKPFLHEPPLVLLERALLGLHHLSRSVGTFFVFVRR